MARPSLPRARQAEAHLRLARCYDEKKDYARAGLHLDARIYAGPEVDAEVRRLADELRPQVEAKLPQPAAELLPPRRDPRERVEEEIRAARGFLESGDAWRALWHAKTALDLDPGNAAAREIDAEAERQLSGAADFIRDPLRFVRKWTETRIAQVATDAQAALAKAVAHADAKRWNLAEAAFKDALALIDACEFGQDSDRLADLRDSNRPIAVAFRFERKLPIDCAFLVEHERHAGRTRSPHSKVRRPVRLGFRSDGQSTDDGSIGCGLRCLDAAHH